MLNSTAFAVTEGQYRVIADTPANDDTESGAFKRYQAGGLQGLEVDLTAHKQTNVAPHVAPLLIDPGTYITITLYPTGTSNTAYTCARFLVREFTGNFRVANSEVQTIRISGMSDSTVVLTTD